MSLDLDLLTSDSTVEQWFAFPDDSDPQCRVKLRFVDAEESDRKMESCTRRRFKRGQQYTEIDNERFAAWVAERLVVAWEGVHLGGQPVPCEEPHKSMVVRKIAGFAKFVVEHATELSEFASKNGAASVTD